MKRLLLFFVIISTFFLFCKESLAIYDPLTEQNNKVGIHIFDPNEIEKVPDLVNSNGGKWGYVTVPLRSDDRDRQKWNKFMKICREKEIIPIIRLATTMGNGFWTKPTRYDDIDFANFLNDLDWPIENRYVVVYNEPNHRSEWGGFISPQDYADVLVQTAEIFKERNANFFILPAGLDMAAPNDREHMNWKSYLAQMYAHNRRSFEVIDGWNSHSYANYGFSGSPYDNHDHSIKSFWYELSYVQSLNGKQLPIFITETGWSNERLSDVKIAEYLKIAFGQAWDNSRIVAITPFVLDAQAGPFEKFSFIGKEGPKPQYNALKDLVKTAGNPKLADNSEKLGFDKVLGAETKFEKVEDAPKDLFVFDKILKIFDVFK